MSLKKKKIQTFDKSFWNFMMIFLLVIILICFFPYLFTHYRLFDIDFSGKGDIGSSIGGIMGPFIAIAASALTFLAFWVQFKANKQQRNDISVERLESSVQHLIEIYRDMVNHMYLYKSDITGQPSFHFIFYEFKSIYNHLYHKINAKSMIDSKDVYNDIITAIEYISFEIFLSGILTQNKDDEKVNFKLNRRIQDMITHNFDKNKDFDLISLIIDEKVLQTVEDCLIDERNHFEGTKRIQGFPDGRYTIDAVRQLYKGNLPRLSSYFSHFYNTLIFIAEKEIDIDKLKESDLYTLNLKESLDLCKKMLFCQMGMHEIALIIAYMSFKKYINKTGKKEIGNIDEKIDQYIEIMKNQLIEYKDTFIWNSAFFHEADV